MRVGFKKYELWCNVETQKYEEQNVEKYFGDVLGAIALNQCDNYGMTHQVPHLVIAVDGGGFEAVNLDDCFQVNQDY